jgi:hypothetical protein
MGNGTVSAIEQLYLTSCVCAFTDLITVQLSTAKFVSV